MKLGEASSLKKIYFRWVGILIVLGIIGLSGVIRYYREVQALSPEVLLEKRPEGMVRVLGRVEAGTLNGGPEGSQFKLSAVSGGKTSIGVRYEGKPYENLRELKVLVVSGEWDTGKMELSALSFGLTPNYGFVVAAYLLSLVPLCLFLFNMERKLILLSILIKEEKGYEPIASPTSSSALSEDVVSVAAGGSIPKTVSYQDLLKRKNSDDK